MSSTKKYLIGIALFLSASFGYSIYNQLGKDKKPSLHSQVVEVSEGYGYQIMQGDRIVILQEFIPCFAGQKPFATTKEALSVANLVLSKLQKGESPLLVPSELSELNITTDSN
jgi:hypothetical protein